MPSRLLLVAYAAVVCVSVAVPQESPHKSQPAVPLLYTAAAEYQPLAWLQGAERFPKGATLFVRSKGTAEPLVAGFATSADANVSFDAKSVLFSGKQHAADHWQIWEVAVPAGTPRQITHCDDDCIKPLYLPGERVVYARRIDGQLELEIASLNGTEAPVRLTHAPGNFLPSDVLLDGRILFEAGYPIQDNRTAELYTVYTDGSGVEAYRCDHGHSRHAGRQMASGDVVFARDGKLFRFTSALAHEVPIAAPAAVYAGDVIESSNNSWVVTSRATTGKHFRLLTWKPGTAAVLSLISDSKTNIIQPALLAPRAVPNRHPSALHEWSYANLLCLNAYTSKDRIREGSIASLRLYTRDAHGAAQVQGTAPVEKDGSFFLKVPGDRPLKIELLDAQGNTVKSEGGWFWLRSGEQRICVGCHAGPERAAENAVPMVLQRSIIPVDLTTLRTSQAPAAGGH